MHIIMVCGRSPFHYFGGAENHVLQISRRLIARGYNVEIYSTFAKDVSKRGCVPTDIPTKIFPALAPRDMYYFSWPLLRALKRSQCDILHGHEFGCFSFLAALLAKKKSQKLVLTPHTAPPQSFEYLRPLYRSTLRHLLRRADKVICVSRYEYDSFSQHSDLSQDLVSIIPNGVILSADRRVSVFEVLGLNRPYILSVGRLHIQKGHACLIRALARMHLKKEREDIDLVIVGSGPDKDILLRLTAELGIQRRVHFFEGLSHCELQSLYANCELFALLSKYESSGIAVMEALAERKPVLVTDDSALSEYVRKGWAVGVPSPPSVQSVAYALNEILREPDRFRPRHVDLLTWDQVAGLLAELYCSIL